MAAQIKREDGEQRFYEITTDDGQRHRLPSVTTVLSTVSKPYLIPWAVSEACKQIALGITPGEAHSEETIKAALKAGKERHVEILTHAGQFGTMAHGLIEERLRTGKAPALEDLPEPVKACFTRFEAWWETAAFHPIEVELIVYSLTHGFAGTMDCLVMNEAGTFVELDWKTSRYYSEEYTLQTIAYKMAYQEMHQVAIGDIYVVKVHRETAQLDVYHIPEREHARLFERFLAVRAVWEWKQGKVREPVLTTAPPKVKREKKDASQKAAAVPAAAPAPAAGQHGGGAAGSAPGTPGADLSPAARRLLARCPLN